jgi:hypothetical protein
MHSSIVIKLNVELLGYLFGQDATVPELNLLCPVVQIQRGNIHLN